MEKFILDTCTWIEYFHKRNGVPEHARKVGRENLCASEVTIAELTYGAINSSDYERHIKEPQMLRRDVTICDCEATLRPFECLPEPSPNRPRDFRKKWPKNQDFIQFF